MYLKNITFSVLKEVSNDFEVWLKPEIEIIKIWAEEVSMFKLLTQVDPESINYSIQFSFKSKEQLDIFMQLNLDQFLAKTQSKFEGKILHFVTLLEKF
ncbi:DUF4286 family protein [Lacihabitans sp. LS3-19]|uniref:DUF4286 family protein n=1 Tax=Lacihabitans sp. LS3-19 TaxID=2487335 RepID=UPI0020CE084A|nr:DUF4286 family protein [Lacihabitans sp. LS3-19]MCP9769989.1 DUF4286 family protein [Lacihabitans sp. LS3-19]